MSDLDPISRDFYEERKRRWRRGAFVRGVVITLLVLVGLGALGAWFGETPRGAHVARVEIAGIIVSDPERDEMYRAILESENVRGVIVRIDSPGGTVVGSEALYEQLGDLGERVPVVAVMDSVAASGGYLAALGTDHIIARGNTITGSIGVIFEFLNFSELLGEVGVEVETIRSSDLKAAASPLRDLTPEAREAEQRLVNDTYDWFRGLVEKERDLTGERLDTVTDGRTFTGRMALEAGLVDALGDEATASLWLSETDASLSGLPVYDWEPEYDEPLFGRVVARLGLGDLLPRTAAAGPRLMAILQ